MTTDHTTGPRDGPHLDDEAISAALDDEAGPADVAHLAGCTRCSDRLASFREAAVAVAAPPPPVPAATRDAAIAAAAAELEAVGSTTRRAPSDLGRRRSRRRGRPAIAAGPWLGVAAAVLLLVLALPLLGELGGDDDDDAATGVAADAPQEEAGAQEEASAALGAPAPAVDVGDLGTIEAGTDLREVADRALGGPASTTAPSAAPGGAAAGSQEDAGGAGSDAAGESGTAGGDASTLAEPERSAADDTPCTAEVRTVLDGPGRLVLHGTATVEDEAAVVLGFDAPGADRPTVLLVVAARSDCRLITFQSYVRG